MAVKIKLARYGKIHKPVYRVVVADARTARNGRSIEPVGRYEPKAEPSIIEVNSERVQYWLGVGAKPTAAVEALLKVTGDWQTFKGLPGTEGTLKPQPEKVDKRARYDAALAAIGGRDSDDDDATTPKKKPAKKPAKAKKADEKPAGAKADEKPEAADEKATEAKVDDKSEKPEAADEKATEAKVDDKSEKPDAADEKPEAADEKPAEAKVDDKSEKPDAKADDAPSDKADES